MKAVVYTRYGTPDVMQVCEQPRPDVATGQVLVKVHATTVNDWDWTLLRGKPHVLRLLSGPFKPKTKILGTEVAGVVKTLGEGVTRFAIGERVYGDLSDAGFGGFAEYVSVSDEALYPMSAGMTFEQAAALPHAGLLALQGLVDIGGIRKADRVLINGAGGGVGAIGLGIAKTYGCEVTGVDKASKLSAMTAMGFDETLDYEQTDFTTVGKRYDLVLDAKTTRSPFQYLNALNANGRYVTVGGYLPSLFQIACMGSVIGRLSKKQLRILALKPNRGLDRINRLFEAGALSCMIDGPFALADVPAAMERFGRADHVGKVVISVV